MLLRSSRGSSTIVYMSITFTVPGKITSANRVTRHVGKVAVKSRSAREDHSRIAARAMTARSIAKWEVPQVAAVGIVAWNSRLDADNLPKCVLDGIKGILILNDSPKRLRRLCVEHRRDKLGERYDVTVDVLV
jgi:hypothetical protein